MSEYDDLYNKFNEINASTIPQTFKFEHIKLMFLKSFIKHNYEKLDNDRNLKIDPNDYREYNLLKNYNDKLRNN